MKIMKLIPTLALLVFCATSAAAESQRVDANAAAINISEVLAAKKVQCQESDVRLKSIIEELREKDADKASALEERRALEQQACDAEIAALESRVASE